MFKLFKFTTCVYFITSTSSSLLKNFLTTESKVSLLNKYVMDVAESYFKQDLLLHIYIPDPRYTLQKKEDIVNDFQKTIGLLSQKTQIMVSNYNTKVTLTIPGIKPSLYLFYISREEIHKEISIQWAVVKKYMESWNPSGYFIFLIYNQPLTDTNEDDNTLSLKLFNSV